MSRTLCAIRELVASGLSVKRSCAEAGVSVPWYYKWRQRALTLGLRRLTDGRRIGELRRFWIVRRLRRTEALIGKKRIAEEAGVSLSTVQRIARSLNDAPLLPGCQQASETDCVVSPVANGPGEQMDFLKGALTLKGRNKLTKLAARYRRKIFEENAAVIEEQLWSCAFEVATAKPRHWLKPRVIGKGRPTNVATEGKFRWVDQPSRLVLGSLRLGTRETPHAKKNWWAAQVYRDTGPLGDGEYALIPSAYQILRDRIRSLQLSRELVDWERCLIGPGEPAKPLKHLLGARFELRAIALAEKEAVEASPATESSPAANAQMIENTEDSMPF